LRKIIPSETEGDAPNKSRRQRSNQSLEPTAGRCTEKLKEKIMNDEVKAKLAVASGGSARSR
jgi:hypothetical protein